MERGEINLIVAMGKDGAIGKDGDLIWKISDDLKRFKKLTTGHPVIMGRKTWESLPKKPLPGRQNIVLTNNRDFMAEGAEVVNSVEEALNIAGTHNPFIIGGAQVYNAFLPYVSTIYITSVEDSCRDADAFLEVDLERGWHLADESEVKSTPEGLKYRYLTYKRSMP